MTRPNEPRESTISAAIIRYINALPRGHARKVFASGYGHAGEPDIDACVDGRSVKVEVKRPSMRKHVTPLQAASLRKWASAGAIVGVVCSVDEVAELINTRGANR